MRNMNKTISLILVLSLVLACGAFGSAAADGIEQEGIGTQLKLISSSFHDYVQPTDGAPWFYTVTDLDHNGLLELLAYSRQNTVSGTAKGWEINPAGAALRELKMPQGLPNLMTDSAETIFDKEKDLWLYTVHSYVKAEGAEEYDVLSGFFLKSGTLENGVLAQRALRSENGQLRQSFYDKDKNEISEDAFYNYVRINYAGMQKTTTSFDWFTAPEADNLARFADSYAVFIGERTGNIGLRGNQTALSSAYVTVTKNPTNETHKQGETAIFIANAGNYSSADWVFVSPSGETLNAQQFRARFPYAEVSGESGTTLTIKNVSSGMSAWGVYCSFTGGGQTTRTNIAYLYVRPDSGALKPADLKNFYETYAYWFGEWVCPFCGNHVVGSYCPFCGYDPDYYYYLYFDDLDEDIDPYDWWYRYYDLELDELDDISFYFDEDDRIIDFYPGTLLDDDYEWENVGWVPLDEYDWDNDGLVGGGDYTGEEYWDGYAGDEGWDRTCPTCGWNIRGGFCTNPSCPSNPYYAAYENYSYSDDYSAYSDGGGGYWDFDLDGTDW